MIPTHLASVSEVLDGVQRRIMEVDSICLLVRLSDGTSMNAALMKEADLAVEMVGTLDVMKAEIVSGLSDCVLVAVDGLKVSD